MKYLDMNYLTKLIENYNMLILYFTKNVMKIVDIFVLTAYMKKDMFVCFFSKKIKYDLLYIYDQKQKWHIIVLVKMIYQRSSI